MSIKKRLTDLVAHDAANSCVVDVRLGLTYTAVKLDDGRAGISYCFGNRLVTGCSVFRGARPLAGRPASQLMEYLLSDDLLECSVGLATVNAIVNVQPSTALPGDVLEVVKLRKSDRVGMIGFFGPLVPALKNQVAQLDIFEESERLPGVCRPSREAFETLPHCDVAIITSTSIVNRTIDQLLEVTKNCRDTVLLGSSTPLIPKAFEDTSVSWLSGIVVHDADGILRTVSEGGGTAFFNPYVTKYNINCREDSNAPSGKNTYYHIGGQ